MCLVLRGGDLFEKKNPLTPRKEKTNYKCPQMMKCQRDLYHTMQVPLTIPQKIGLLLHNLNRSISE